MRSEPLPVGIQLEPGRGFLVEARVRPYPKERKRFPLGTPVATMERWRDAKVDELKAARQAVERAQAQLAPVGLDPVPARQAMSLTTLRDDVETYLAEKLRPSMHPQTKTQFTRWLKMAARTDLGRYPRALITGRMWDELLTKWERYGIPHSPDEDLPVQLRGRKRTVPPGPLDVDTVHKIRTCWIGFYTAMDAGLKLPNPARDIPRRQAKGDPEGRGLPMDVALRILDAVPAGTRTAARLMLMCVCGLRPCEVMKIRPDRDWHRERKTLAIRTAKGGRPRTLALGARAIAALEELARLDGFGLFTTAPAARIFHQAVAKAGLQQLEPLRPYDLRHTFGTEAYRQTGNLKAVADAMGQRTMRMTERYVQAAVDEKVAEVCAAVAASAPLPKKARQRGALREVVR